MLCALQDGTLMGAVKFNSILPWELDGDLTLHKHNFSAFPVEFGPLARKHNYKVVCISQHGCLSAVSEWSVWLILAVWLSVPIGQGGRLAIQGACSGQIQLVCRSLWRWWYGHSETVKQRYIWHQDIVWRPASEHTHQPWPLRQKQVPAINSYRQSSSPTCLSGFLISPAHTCNRYGKECYRHVQHWLDTHRGEWSFYDPKDFKKCSRHDHHACLDQFYTDGSLQFLWWVWCCDTNAR